MSAFALAFFLTLYWTLLGTSLLAALKSSIQFHLRLLTAAPLGLAVNLLALFLLSRAGLAIRQVAIPLFLLGLLFAIHVGLTRRHLWRRRQFHALQLLTVVALLPFLWPLLKFGFEWLAFVNGDMSFYSLSASRFLEYGYAELPASGNIYDQRDYSLAYWAFPNLVGHRAGADLLLAQAIAVSGLTAHQVYMSLILACHVCVATSAGALTLLGVRKWSAALWTTVLVALSPMLTLEVTKQLLAQAIGLSLLVSACGAYVMAMRTGPDRLWVGATVVLIAGLAIVYSEVLPFFALFALVHEIARFEAWRHGSDRLRLLRNIGLMALSIAVLLNTYLVDIAKFILFAMGSSFKSSAMSIQTDGLSLFPYFFVPSNGALLFGWLPLGAQAGSLVTLAGLAALVGFVGLTLFAAWRGIPAALMSLVMLAVAASMYAGGNGFGLFKLAMFSQPFILSTVVVLATLFLGRLMLRYAALALLGLSFTPAQSQVVAKVSSDIGQVRVPFASTARLGEQLRKLGERARAIPDLNLYSDTPNREMMLLQSYYFKNTFFSSLSLPTSQEFTVDKLEGSSNFDRLSTSSSKILEKVFDFDPETPAGAATFKTVERRDRRAAFLITTSQEFSPINRFNLPPGKQLLMRPLDGFVNHLVFRNSSLGASYVTGNWTDGGVSYWDIEADPLFIGDTMVAIGRYQLYEVINPRAGSRVRMAITASMDRSADFRLPQARVVGARHDTLPLVGRGSARVIGPPIAPRVMGNEKLLGIDFGRDGTLEHVPRPGAMALFGSNVKLDIRKKVAFARDISYITSEQYDSMWRPQRISNFPAALRDPALEYSGIYEDGWLSEQSYVVLDGPLRRESSTLRLTGMLPGIGDMDFKTTLKISINGNLVYQAQHGPGEIKLALPLSSVYFRPGDKALVLIQSSALQRLPDEDGRPVSIHLDYLGYQTGT
jgi:hypothetical protein